MGGLPFQKFWICHWSKQINCNKYLQVTKCSIYTLTQTDAVGDGRLCSRCRHLANWTKHTCVVFDCGLLHPLYENMTSSTKPEVLYLSHCRQESDRFTATSSMYRKFSKIWMCSFYPRDAMLARYLLSSCLVRLSVCLFINGGAK